MLKIETTLQFRSFFAKPYNNASIINLFSLSKQCGRTSNYAGQKMANIGQELVEKANEKQRISFGNNFEHEGHHTC